MILFLNPDSESGLALLAAGVGKKTILFTNRY